jgi:Na+/proline symporter
MLYGLGLFVASTCRLPLVWTILGSGLVILAYCVVGGLWAVVITDFLQAVILMPFTLVMLVASLTRVGGLAGLLAGLPPEMKSLALPGEFGWLYVGCWTLMVSFGYNTAAMAQRYFSVDDEASSRKVALLCFGLFVLGAFIWFVPPLAMRVVYPDLKAIWPGLANPHEASYAVAALTLLPNGLVGIMLAAMFSATMSSLSGLFNMHAAVISKDIYQTFFAKRSSERQLLVVGWLATFGVGATMTGLAMSMAARGASIFEVMLTFNTVMSLAYGPPALLGLVVKRTPSWSGLLTFAVGLALGLYGAFVGHWGLVWNVLIIIPASTAVFFLSALAGAGEPGRAARRDALFARLATPIDMAHELRDSTDPTAEVFRFLSRATAGVGLLSLLLVFAAEPGERQAVIFYGVITLLVAAALTRVGRGRSAPAPAKVACVALLLWPALPAEAGLAHVWAVSDGEKIGRDDLASPWKNGNSAWDGRRVRLFAARNEIVAFQVVAESDAAGIRELRVTVKELKQRGGDSRIVYAPPAADPTDFVGRPIQLFAVHYLNVTETTHADWAWKPGSPAAPRDTTGWKPVQLVPENARPGRGGLPLPVAPSQNQAVWVEVYTGRDRPAGTYEGTLTIVADGRTQALPVELELFDFALPDENSMTAMVYYESSQPELYHGRNLDPAYHRSAHRHRVELVNAYDQAALVAHRGRFDGSDFTAAHGYEGPGQNVGNRLAPVSFYGPGEGWDDRASAWKKSDAWMTFLTERLPGVRTFLYMPDEPAASEFSRILNLAANVHSNPGPGRALPIFVTKHWVQSLAGGIDIWCAGPQHFDLARVASERARGRSYWTYNGGRPNGPALVIDAPATEARAMIWGAFKHGIDVYFYWHGVHWLHNRQKQGERRQNVWVNPITFDNRGQPHKTDHGYINGDGVLFYPGEEKVHPEEDRGLAGPCATVQLANLRRGLQDHQYLTLARQRGLGPLVDEVMRDVVPRMFSDAGETVGFAETGDAFEAARRKLAVAIAGARQGTSR